MVIYLQLIFHLQNGYNIKDLSFGKFLFKTIIFSMEKL